MPMPGLGVCGGESAQLLQIAGKRQRRSEGLGSSRHKHMKQLKCMYCAENKLCSYSGPVEQPS